MLHKFPNRNKPKDPDWKANIRKVWYAGLESIEARYTLQLQEWNRRAFKDQGIPFHPIVPEANLNVGTGTIVTGSVLDAHGRTFFSLQQTAMIVELLKAGKMRQTDVLFFEDMFTPGAEALLYIFDQTPVKYRPRVFVRCLAQSIDPDDFVNREGMFDWMRSYERVVEQLVIKTDGAILVASEEMVAHLRIAGFKAPIFVTGLPFGKDEVQSRVPKRKPWAERANQVVFAARWDDEKQPLFFIRLIEHINTMMPKHGIKFIVASGNAKPKSNNPKALDLVRRKVKNLEFRWGLKKNEYYQLLAESKLLFNCALQDWVSNTVSEASALGTMQLYPAYRSFPEVFENDADFMYIPWSIEDAAAKIIKYTINNEAPTHAIHRAATKQDHSIYNTIQVMRGRGGDLARNGNDYRKYVTGYGMF